MIVSNDSITMKPPYDITPNILKLISSISEKIGEINANYLNKPSTTLRKQNRIKNIIFVSIKYYFCFNKNMILRYER